MPRPARASKRLTDAQGDVRVRRRCPSAATTSRSSPAGATAFRRPGRGGHRGSERPARHHARRGVGAAGRRCRAAGTAPAGDRAQTARHRSGIEHGAVGTGDARAACRSLRRRERRRTRRAGARGEAGRHLPARACLSPADDQREDRRGARRRRRAQRQDRRRRGHHDAVRQAHARATIPTSTTMPTRWRPPTSSSPPASPRTRSSSPTSSRSAGRRRTPRFRA